MIRKIISLMVTIVAVVNTFAQNKYEEEIDCDVKDGKIILLATVKGTSYRFLLDVTRASSAVLAEYADKMEMQVSGESGALEKLGIGQNLFIPKTSVEIINDNNLKQLGVAGVLGANVFKNNVLTINKKEKNISLSSPYKPAYMSLRNRTDMISGSSQTVSFAGKTVKATVDSLLNTGVISFDLAKAKIYFEPYETFVKPETPKPVAGAETVTEGLITHLDRATFLRDVFNFRQNSEWKYQGDMPCVIDFWATWCIPCRKIDPIIKELAKEYEGRVKFYKINVDDEKEIAAGYFNINAIPQLLYVPTTGKPELVLAVASIEEIRKKIEALLLKE